MGSPMLDVIVQGEPGADLAPLVERYGGQVMRELSVIDAVAVRLPAHNWLLCSGRRA
jgi:hypothetical protein